MQNAPPKKSFWSELKRRHVVRVAIAYAVAGFVVIEAADIMLPALNLPDWTVTLVLALTLLGFPIALGLAWAFDVTPEGVVRTGPEAVAVAEPPESPPGVDEAGPSDRSGQVEHAQDLSSIAVLPFVDMSPDGDQEYFGDGIAEELINSLVKVPGFKVSARTSSFQFKDKGEDVTEIGRALKVATVLEGSIRKSGDRLRITAQLISVSDGFHLWSETYDRTLDDVFAIQDELARSIVAECVASLGDDAPDLVEVLTTNTEAYDLYLKARHLWARRSEFGLETALEFFRKAVELDPDYPLPYAGIADVYAILAFYGMMSPHDAAAEAAEPVRLAGELGPDLPETQFSQALYAWMFELDLVEAEKGFRRASELRSGFGDALAWLGLSLGPQGRVDEAEEAGAAARKAEPDSLYVKALYALIPSYGRQYQRACERADALLAEHPDYLIAQYVSALVYIPAGRWTDAIRETAAAMRATPEEPFFLGLYGQALRGGGRGDEADEIVERLEAMRESRYVSGLSLAWARIGSDDERDREALLASLVRAIEGREPFLYWTLMFNYWDPYRDDPRIQAALERSGVVFGFADERTSSTGASGQTADADQTD